MRSGDMRHRIVLQRPVESRDNFNEIRTTWTTADTVYAAVDPNAGRRYFEALQANAEVQGAVRIRYRSDIDPTWRILYGNRILAIIYISDPQERHRELIIYYKEAQD